MLQTALRVLATFLISAVFVSSAATPPSITQNLPNSQTNRVGQNFTLSITAAGDTPLTYEWFKDNEPIPLASIESYTLSNLALEDAGIYRVRVRNAAGTINSANCTLYVAIPITITRQPSNTTVGQGQTARFFVETIGSHQTYQWFRSGARINGATNSILELPNVQPSDFFSYRVTVSNILGSVTSSSANLTVATLNLTTQPISQNVAIGTNVTLRVSASGSASEAFSPLHYQWYKDDVAITRATNATFNTNSVQLKDSGNYWVVVSNNWLIRTSAVARLDVWAIPTFSRQPMSRYAKPGETITLEAAVSETSAVNYQWHLNSFPIPGATTSSLTLTNLQSQNFGSYSVIARFPGSPIGRRSAFAFLDQAVLEISNDLQDIATTNGAPALLYLSAIGTTPITYFWFKENTQLDVPSENILQFPAVGPEHVGNYHVIVSNAWYVKTSSVARLVIGDPIIITKQPPESRIIGQGKTARFEVEVASAGPVTYQWHRRIMPIEGATNSFLEITNIDPSHADNYWVTISNAVLSVRSNDSWLYVAILSITDQPDDLILAEGQYGKLEVTALGVDPFTYQWFKNNTAIPGATSNAFTIIGAQPSDAGNYYAIVSNQWLSVISLVASVKVGRAPDITQVPLPQTVNLGDRVQFEVEATDSNPLTYAWLLNGEYIPGATNSTLVIEKTVSGDHGSYNVAVQNILFTAFSQNAQLTFSGTENFTNGLVAYYPLDRNSIDFSGHNNHLEAVNNVQIGGDRWGKLRAYQFNGTDSGLVRSSALVDLGSPGFTFALWFKTFDPQKSYQAVFNSVPHNGLYVVLNHPPLGSPLQWLIGSGGSWITPHQHVTNFTILENTWRHLTFTRENQLYRLYIDGELASELDFPNAPTNSIPSGLYLGSIDVANQPLNGALDDVRVYSRTLTANEVRALYDFEKAPDRNAIFMILDPTQPSRFKASGPNGVGFTLEISNDLQSWQPIDTNRFSITPFEFTADPGAPKLFFRATSPR